MKHYFTLVCICIAIFAKANHSSKTNTHCATVLREVNIYWSKHRDINNLDVYLNLHKKYSNKELIQLHLQLVEKVLRSRNIDGLTIQQKNERLKNLDNLHQYWLSNSYPVNNKVLYRNPVFIDDYNTFCAVGYLIKTSNNEPLARDC